MRYAFAAATIALMALCSRAGAESLRFCRTPAPSPNGGLVAFGYAGDIWVVPAAGGAARRITSDPAYDGGPAWSPDGMILAFTSDRSGNDDVYTIGIDGGPAKRLTWHSSNDSACGFSPDGSCVLFLSSRPGTWGIRPRLFEVPVSGGMPRPVMAAECRQAQLSGDGKVVAFVRGSSPWWRIGYRGSAEPRIWLGRPGTGKFGRALEGEGNQLWPCWGRDGTTLYFCTDPARGHLELWRLDLATQQARKMAGFPGYSVRFPRISADGRTLAFAAGDGMYVMDAAGTEPRRIEAEAPLDRVDGETLLHEHSSGAECFSAAVEGAETAIVVRGDVFVYARPSGKEGSEEPPGRTFANRITSTPSREKDVCMSPCGKTVVFASDLHGGFDLFAASSSDPSEPALSRTLKVSIRRLTQTPGDECEPVYSPDGRKIAFRRGLGDLAVMDMETGAVSVASPGWNLSSFSWSPDGAWFALSRSDEEYNEEVFLVRSDGSGAAINLSMHPDDDYHPVWFPNGRAVAFVSKRSRDDMDVWMALLRKRDAELDAEDLWRAWTGGDERASDTEEGGSKRRESVPVVVDEEDIHLRLRQLSSLAGDEGAPAVSRDSLSVVFPGPLKKQRALWSVRFDGSSLKTLEEDSPVSGGLRFSGHGKSILFLDRSGCVRTLDAGGGRSKAAPFRSRVRVDPAAERMQVFEEAWRALDAMFYDPHFHGADWKAARERHLPLAKAASCPEDFRDAVCMMLGELNASHLGFSVPGRPGAGDSTGSLGVEFDPAHAGPGLKVAMVVPGGPADREESRLEPGDVVLSVMGTEVSFGVNVHSLLDRTQGSRILLSVRRAAGGEPVDIVIRPFSVRDESAAWYEAGVERCRDRVERWSAGRLGYLHVPGMNWPSFERFEREIYSAGKGKEGLLIDVRDNGGGWTADMLLTVLSVREHATTKSRGGGFGYPQGRRPFYAWTRPAAVLCNEGSFSNAEIFAHAFKTLGRGPLIGRPTHGGVISTGGMVMQDGSWLRLPTRGWRVWPDGPDMELNGAIPDHDVPMEPQDEESGEDPQLKKAVQVLLDSLGK